MIWGSRLRALSIDCTDPIATASLPACGSLDKRLYIIVTLQRYHKPGRLR
jgi:hypothetical protein